MMSVNKLRAGDPSGVDHFMCLRQFYGYILTLVFAVFRTFTLAWVRVHFKKVCVHVRNSSYSDETDPIVFSVYQSRKKLIMCKMLFFLKFHSY